MSRARLRFWLAIKKCERAWERKRARAWWIAAGREPSRSSGIRPVYEFQKDHGAPIRAALLHEQITPLVVEAHSTALPAKRAARHPQPPRRHIPARIVAETKA